MSRLVGTLSTAVVDRFSFGPYDRRDTSNIVPLALLDHWGGVEYQCLECRRPIYLDISRLEYPNWRHHNRRWRGDRRVVA